MKNKNRICELNLQKKIDVWTEKQISKNKLFLFFYEEKDRARKIERNRKILKIFWIFLFILKIAYFFADSKIGQIIFVHTFLFPHLL